MQLLPDRVVQLPLHLMTLLSQPFVVSFAGSLSSTLGRRLAVMAVNGNKNPFESINRSDVPRTRKGKHHDIIEQILKEVPTLRAKKALRIPRSALGSAKLEHIRAALTRASTRLEVNLATSSDDRYFYVWRQD